MPHRRMLLFLALLMLGSARMVSGEPVRVRHVFIISIDGGKPAVMRVSRMPNLFAMAAQGASTWQARTVLPSVTLVSHTSMLTGVGPQKHHVLWNDWEPKRGAVRVPTVFSLAKEHGLTTAMFVGKEKLRHLETPDAVDRFSRPGYSAREVAARAARFIADSRPNLCFLHFPDPDGAGHRYGWGSARQRSAFSDVDSALAVVRKAIEQAGIARASVVIVTADHGGHGRTHGTARPDDVRIPWIAWGAGVRPGYRIAADVRTFDTAATALWLLGVRIPADWDGRPVREAFEPSVTGVQ